MFEPHAIVWAEEPGTIVAPVEAAAALGPGQRPGHPRATGTLWFRPGSRRAHGLGWVSFGLFWFCLFLQPVFMITSSAGAARRCTSPDFPRVWLAFHVLWIINAATYVFITVLRRC